MEDTIQVIYKNDKVLIVLGEAGIELTRAEAEQLFVDLGHSLQDMDKENEGKSE